MLSTLIANQALSPPTGVHLTSDPDPPYAHGSGLFTNFFMQFNADPINHTYCEIAFNGVFLGSALALPGATSLDISNASFGSAGNVTGFATHANASSRNAWPRSPEVNAPETIAIP